MLIQHASFFLASRDIATKTKFWLVSLGFDLEYIIYHCSFIMASSMLSRLRSIPVQYPFAFGVVFSGFKTSASDLMAQKLVEQRETIDWKRNMAFAAFGFIYLGGVQYSIYVPLFGRIFPTAKTFAAKSLAEKLKDARGMFECVAQVLVDQCLHHPFMYFPAFYCTRELVMHSDNPDLMQCLRDYQRNMKEDLLALWTIWIPATLFNFAFMPMWARIPTVATTSLVWSIILSTMRGGDVKGGVEVAGGAVTGATLHMVEEGLGTLFTQPVELESNMSHIMITAGGLDKPGWVAELSRAIADAGGSITHSRMVRLGADFIITLHASVPPEKERAFTKVLRADKGLKPLNLQFKNVTQRENMVAPPQLGVRVRAVGEDRYVLSHAERVFLELLSFCRKLLYFHDYLTGLLSLSSVSLCVCTGLTR